ncbi:MAG TPA: RHS repeat-associated core domain-containing protein, partial [Thermoanaerobaculia bacterium]
NDYYVYDANDERIGALSAPSGSWKWTIRGAGGEVVREYESANFTNAPWIWLEDFVHRGGRVVASEREQAEGGRRHFHLDHLGTVRMVTNHEGQAVSRHDYTPYGLEATPLSQEMDRGYSRANTLVFTGHERDYNSGTATQNTDYLDYMHARYYKASWGRFLSVDSGRDSHPRQPQSWNLYTYVRNNPMLLVDPDETPRSYAVNLRTTAS